jgi:hypothetical protein
MLLGHVAATDQSEWGSYSEKGNLIYQIGCGVMGVAATCTIGQITSNQHIIVLENFLKML